VTWRHSDRPPKWCSRCGPYVYTWVAAVYLELVLSPTLVRDHNNCLWSHL